MFPHSFDAAVSGWFRDTFEAPTACQVQAWEALAAGDPALIAAPTGSGKTLAAFLTAISDLAATRRRGELVDETTVLYVSPLKALSNDVRKNLEEPLASIDRRLDAELDLYGDQGDREPSIRAAVRTGDTPAAARALMRRRPPHILVTTPESLYILLTSDGGRDMLATVRTVIIDEIHALVANKRGAHLALSLARLDRLTATPAQRVGLSATQRPIGRVAEFLLGKPLAEGRCRIVDEGHVRARDVAIEMPPSPLETVVSAEVSDEIRERLANLVETHTTTLIFVNTRRMAERLARALADRLGEEQVCAHHGSMSRERRLDAEQRLKSGRLKALVATASLELGIDIGDVDLVCQLGATRSLAMLLQRIGRSGHAVGGVAKGRLFPQTRDELLESIALLDMMRRDELDSVVIPDGPNDVLAQQIVAEVCCGEISCDALFKLTTNAWNYRNLKRQVFDSVIDMLAEGYAFAQGRRGAYLHHDAVNGELRPRRGARLVAVTCGGAIPDTADYDVIAEPHGERVGTVNEDFAIESLPGNIFQLGNTSWRVLRVESSALRVEDAAGEPPNMPFWLGEAPARSSEFSAAMSRLRAALGRLCEEGAADPAPLAAQLAEIPGVGPVAARQAADYAYTGYHALGAMPTQQTLVMERFFDESGGMQLVIHSPFGSRLNKAWGLALRKRFCRTFNFELQAAAVEDAIVISLGAVHSFELNEVWRYLAADSVRDVLVQALLDAPLFNIRWRWVATCALAIQRFRGGHKTPPRLIRMNAEDLVALVFPDQLACAENLSGRREVPDHPLVSQAIADCLHEAMDIDALEALIGAIRNGSKTLIAKDLTEPSPFALQVLNANPYAFLDDAPLEERRTQAVSGRRWLDPAAVGDLADLDASAIARVREEIWPQPRDADELHEAVLLLGLVTDAEMRALCAQMPTSSALAELRESGRLVAVMTPVAAWISTERYNEIKIIWPECKVDSEDRIPARLRAGELSAEDAWQRQLRSRAEMCGPLALADLARVYGAGEGVLRTALTALEQQGVVLRGRYDPGVGTEQWCDRRLLARIHRYTLGRLRREIEPVSGAAFMRFLFDWQHVSASTRLQGAEGVAAIIAQLSGFEAPAAGWEPHLLAGRIRAYQGTMLDDLMRSGRCAWLRRTPKRGSGGARQAGTLRNTPLTLLPRPDLALWLRAAPEGFGADALGAAARTVLDAIGLRGASFFDDLTAATGLLRSECENALDELAAAGFVTCDSFAGLRALTTPAAKRNRFGGRRRHSGLGIEEAGRWDLLRRQDAPADDAFWRSEAGDNAATDIARILLERYGVVFRGVLGRETDLPPWRYLLWSLRRLEGAGEVRGGRFVAGHAGEQFALPEAVKPLRDARKQGDRGGVSMVNAADPLNQAGLLLPGSVVPAVSGNQLAFVDGEVAGVRRGSSFELADKLDAAVATKVRTALIDRPTAAGRRPARRWR